MPDIEQSMDLSLVIPTLNEAGNIGEVVTRASRVLAALNIDFEILIIDGNSTDGTCQEAAAAGAVAIRDGGNSYGDALRSGFSAARGAVIVTMDSDLSHEPEFISTLWHSRDRAEIVIASRYVSGGRADMSAFRYILSRILNLVFTLILRIPVRDISSGFRLYHKSALEQVNCRARDFDVLEELLIKLYIRKMRVLEVPMHYKPRKHGQSHAKLSRFAIAYLKTLLKMCRLRYTGEK
jgi:dolichol-phosphate mannosyltransferase